MSTSAPDRFNHFAIAEIVYVVFGGIHINSEVVAVAEPFDGPVVPIWNAFEPCGVDETTDAIVAAPVTVQLDVSVSAVGFRSILDAMFEYGLDMSAIFTDEVSDVDISTTVFETSVILTVRSSVPVFGTSRLCTSAVSDMPKEPVSEREKEPAIALISVIDTELASLPKEFANGAEDSVIDILDVSVLVNDTEVLATSEALTDDVSDATITVVLTMLDVSLIAVDAVSEDTTGTGFMLSVYGLAAALFSICTLSKYMEPMTLEEPKSRMLAYLAPDGDVAVAETRSH